MNLINYLSNEWKTLIHNRVAWLVLVVTALSPAIGFFVRIMYQSPSENTFAVLIPVKIASLIGSLLFSLLTLYELDRIYRQGITSIIETVVNTRRILAAKPLAILLFAGVTAVSAAMVFLPFTFQRLGDWFDPILYTFSYGVILLPALVFSVLLASGFYGITRRIDISLLLIGSLFFVSYNDSFHYLLNWIQTNIPAYSDNFGNALVFRITIWNRLTWIFLSMAVFFIGLTATRRYEKSLFGSIKINSRKPGIVILVVALLVTSAGIYGFEPYFDNSRPIQYEMISDPESGTASVRMITVKEENSNVILDSTHLNIEVAPRTAGMKGKVVYHVRNTSGKPQIVAFSIRPGYSIESLKINGQPALYRDLNLTDMNNQRMELDVPASEESSIEFVYGGRIRNDRLIQNLLASEVISEENVYILGAAVAPTIDVEANKSSLSGEVILPADLVLVTQGKVNRIIESNPEKKTNTWSIESTGSRLAVIASHYIKEEIQAGGINIDFYYHVKYSPYIRKVEASKIIKEAVDSFTNMYGALNYNDIPLKIVDSSVLLAGGFASGNISCMGEGIFDPGSFSENNLEGTNGVEVLVHEIAHQWWGTSVRFETNGAWSAEGLTVYSTSKFMEQKYGPSYSNQNGREKWVKAVEQLKRTFYYRHPEYLKIIPADFLFHVLGTNNSIVMYDQMPLQIDRAEKILGEKKMMRVLSKLFKRYKNDLTYQDFLFQAGLSAREISVD
jgi:hypothetical protein